MVCKVGFGHRFLGFDLIAPVELQSACGMEITKGMGNLMRSCRTRIMFVLSGIHRIALGTIA